jgi:flagellar biosynthesis protein FliP
MKPEIQTLLNQASQPYEQMPFEQLKELAKSEEPITYNVTDRDKTWQIEVNVFFANTSKETVVVSVSIDNGGWRALMPHNVTFERAR